VIELVLPYPISANRYWRPVRIGAHITIVPTKEAKAYRTECARIAAALVKQPLRGRIWLNAYLYPHRPLDWQTRARKLGETWDDGVQCIDLGNAEKVMSDALQGIVFADDCMYRRIVLERMEPDAGPARLLVRIDQVPLVAPQLDLLGELPAPPQPPQRDAEFDPFGVIPKRTRKAEHAR
jgi:crossover junction endodeoxyribonuclease RusA